MWTSPSSMPSGSRASSSRERRCSRLSTSLPPTPGPGCNATSTPRRTIRVVGAPAVAQHCSSRYRKIARMRTLLLADDNVTVQRVIALTFAREPVRVVTASDGHQAMDRVVVDRPDIVLAGTTLPQVNGYDLARFVKSKAESRNVPVLLLSGAFEIVDEAQLKSSGANGVIEKPVEPLAVISRVKELLGMTSEGDAASPAAERPGLPASAAGPGAPLPTVPRLVTSTRPMPPEDPRGEAPEASAARAGDDYLDSLES